MTVHDRVEQLAALVARQAKLRLPAQNQQVSLPKVKANGELLDAISREGHLRMVRDYRRHYPSMRMLINRATIEYSLDELPDQELLDLHAKLEQAMDCIKMDIPFDDADLMDNYF